MSDLILNQPAPLEHPLRRYTPARVGLERAGSAIAIRDQLRFQLDHARTRDAVHNAVDLVSLLASLRDRNLEALTLDTAVSPAGPRSQYLRRPDLGRKLSPASAAQLRQHPGTSAPDAVIIIADGLSALAIDRHALLLLDALIPHLAGWQLAPVCVVRNARVAIGDEIGHILHAQLSILLIGERPGLSAPDSLGVYLTWQPRPGRTDAERNCISNIRLEGLGYDEAAARIALYLNAARKQQGTGFALKQPPSPNLPAIG